MKILWLKFLGLAQRFGVLLLKTIMNKIHLLGLTIMPNFYSQNAITIGGFPFHI